MSSPEASVPTTAGVQQSTPIPPPATQEQPKSHNWRSGWPDWMKELPHISFPPPKPDYQLIDPKRIDTLLSEIDEKARKAIKDDIEFMERELMRLFRRRDAEASIQQNRYRLYQIGYILLAMIASILGGAQALMLSTNASFLPFVAFLETVIALFATYLATVSNAEQPFPAWMNNRRRAEALRREFYRYLMRLAPYDSVHDYHRKLLLSKRAAEIDAGNISDSSDQNAG